MTFLPSVKNYGTRDIDLRTIEYNLAINKLGKQRKWQEIEKQFQQMRTESVPQNLTTYTNYTRWLASQKKIERIGEMFLEMRNNPTIGDPHSLIHHSLLNVWISKGEVKPVQTYLDRMKRDSFKLDWIAFSTVLSCYERKGMWDKMLELYDEMKASGNVCDAKIVSLACTAWSRKGDLKKMLEANEDLKLLNLPPDQCTYKAMVDGFGKLGELAQMEKYYEEHKDAVKPGYKWEVIQKMIEWYTANSKPEKATEWEERRKNEGVEEPPKREPLRSRRRS